MALQEQELPVKSGGHIGMLHIYCIKLRRTRLRVDIWRSPRIVRLHYSQRLRMKNWPFLPFPLWSPPIIRRLRFQWLTALF